MNFCIYIYMIKIKISKKTEQQVKLITYSDILIDANLKVLLSLHLFNLPFTLNQTWSELLSLFSIIVTAFLTNVLKALLTLLTLLIFHILWYVLLCLFLDLMKKAPLWLSCPDRTLQCSVYQNTSDEFKAFEGIKVFVSSSLGHNQSNGQGDNANKKRSC